MVRFKLQDRSEFETLFCDYGMFFERSLQLVGCRCKTFVVGQLPCDHAIKVGSVSLVLDVGVLDVFPEMTGTKV
jgi:hypothetical protein